MVDVDADDATDDVTSVYYGFQVVIVKVATFRILLVKLLTLML